MQNSRDWAPWRTAPNLSNKERVDLNNDEFWRLMTKAPVGRVIQIAATLTIANYARSLTLAANHQMHAQLNAFTMIGICICLAAFAVLMIQASKFNHNLKLADRNVHPPNWWRMHCALHYIGVIVAGLLFSAAVAVGLQAVEGLF